MTSPDKSSGPAAGYLPDPLDVWSALESVYWSAQQSAHPWAEALAGLRDTYLGVQSAALVVARINDPATPEAWQDDPRALVSYDLGRLVVGERAWPVRLTTALATGVNELPPDMDVVRGRWQVRVSEFARRTQYALDCLAAGEVPTEVGLEGVRLHVPGERLPAAPVGFLGGPHGGLLASTEESIAQAEQTVDTAALWVEYLGEWATAAVYVLALDHRAQLVELFVDYITGGGRRDG